MEKDWDKTRKSTMGVLLQRDRCQLFFLNKEKILAEQTSSGKIIPNPRGIISKAEAKMLYRLNIDSKCGI